MSQYFSIWFSEFIMRKNPPYVVWELKDSAGITNTIDTHAVFGAILNSSDEDQARVKNILTKIDYYEGDINEFFLHLAKWIIEEYPASEVS